MKAKVLQLGATGKIVTGLSATSHNLIAQLPESVKQAVPPAAAPPTAAPPAGGSGSDDDFGDFATPQAGSTAGGFDDFD